MIRKNFLKTISVILITLIIFYLIFTQIDLFSLIKVLSGAKLSYLLLAFFLTLLLPFIAAKRWQILLHALGYEIPHKRCLYVILAALPLISVTPSKVGDVMRAHYLRNEIPRSKTLGSVLTERLWDVLLLIMFVFLGLIFYPLPEIFLLSLLILAIIVIFLFTSSKGIKLPVSDSWNKKIQNLLLSTKLLINSKRNLCLLTFYTSLLWFVAILQTQLFFLALGIKVPVLFISAVIPIAIFIGQIPITLGGMGTRDSAIIFLFSSYGQPSQLLGVGILFSLFRFWSLSLLGIPFMRKLLRE